MDFSQQLDELEQHASEAQQNAAAAAKESRQKMRARIDQARVDADLAVKEVTETGDKAAEKARNQWTQLKVDTAAKMSDVRKRLDQRDAEIDAKRAARDAERAEEDAADAVDYATWATDNARLAVLDAIDARAHANDLAALAGKQ